MSDIILRRYRLLSNKKGLPSILLGIKRNRISKQLTLGVELSGAPTGHLIFPNRASERPFGRQDWIGTFFLVRFARTPQNTLWVVHLHGV